MTVIDNESTSVIHETHTHTNYRKLNYYHAYILGRMKRSVMTPPYFCQ